VRTSDRLRNTIAMTHPGTQVQLEVMHHDGKTATIKPKLGELTDEIEQAAAQQAQPQRSKPQVRRWTWQSP
jgi:hypothetical protein